MRVFVLTSSLTGWASVCLPYLVRDPGIEIALVLYSEGQQPRPWLARWRRARKAARLGILGSLVGIHLRPWFSTDVRDLLHPEPIDQLAERNGIRFERTPSINCGRTVEIVTECGADLGLCLGNGYVGPGVFTVPRYGMINVHHEMLPEFRGAHSAIWQIYVGSRETGYTIHQIDRHLDTGAILWKEAVPIDLQPTLRETTSRSVARLYTISAEKLAHVVRDYPAWAARATPQGEGHTYTTPTYPQYRRMVRRHRDWYRAAQDDLVPAHRTGVGVERAKQSNR